MTFRHKLLAVFSLTVFLSVAAVAWLVSAMTRRAPKVPVSPETATRVHPARQAFVGRRGHRPLRPVPSATAPV